MRFFRDSCVTLVLDSSCILYTLRISALASCFALPPASLQLCARDFLALIAMEGMYAGFAGAKACQKKSLFLEAPLIMVY